MEVLLKGIGVGLAVAIPVGPIGLLCIRRTMASGRGMGLASGIGAAAADMTYGLMVAAGFAATGLLVSYAIPMQMGGGILIALLGVMSILAFPRAAPVNAKAPDKRVFGILGAFATTYVLTMSNPMTILTFVGLVAGLGASAQTSPMALYWLVFGVFLGSALWWFFLVHATLAARTRMTHATTRWLDLISGMVLLVWGGWIAAGAVSSSTL